MEKPMNVALTTIAHAGDFLVEGMVLRYSSFMPRLYNFCKSIGMERGMIMPSRAFCSDESQGFPIILITKHFGAFPFNHGRLGGVVSTDRHDAYAVHGRDLVVIHASHVGYDPETDAYGMYRRLQREDQCETSACGRIDAVVQKYLSDYRFAQNNIWVNHDSGECIVTIDNQLLDANRRNGLFLDLDFMLARQESSWFRLVKAYSTAKSFVASPAFAKRLRERGCGNQARAPLGTGLTPELFRFKREFGDGLDMQLERNLLGSMPHIVTAGEPLLVAAQASAQVEFDRACRSVASDPSYHGKTLIYVCGMNVDISPSPGQLFPTTLFVPWAAYVQPRGGDAYILEQAELIERLMAQNPDNPDQIDLDEAIEMMGAEKVAKLEHTRLRAR
jgi:hypothetical protein